MPTLVPLPIRNTTWLCQWSHGRLTPHISLREAIGEAPSSTPTGPASSRLAIGERGWIATISPDHRKLAFLRVYPDGLRPFEVELPDDLEEIRSVVFRDDRAFVAGASSWSPDSRLGWIDLSAPKPCWYGLDIGELVPGRGKPVLRLMLDGDHLLAIDGGFVPKLALFYDISTPVAPTLLRHMRIPSGLNDDVLDAAVGRSYLVLLSASRHDEGKAWKIAVYDRSTLDEVATVFHRADWSTPLEIPHAVRMHDDLLLLAHGSKGLGVLRLEDHQPSRFPHLPGVRPWVRPYIPHDSFTYLAPLGAGRVVDLPAVTAEDDSAFVVVERGRGIWWEAINLGLFD